MTSEIVKTRTGYKVQVRDDDGTIVHFEPGRIHLPPDPIAEDRSRRAVQQVFRQQYEEQEAAKAAR